jgi:hypothetical protein
LYHGSSQHRATGPEEQYNSSTSRAGATEEHQCLADGLVAADVEQYETREDTNSQEQVAKALIEGKQPTGLGVGGCGSTKALVHYGLHEPQPLHAEDHGISTPTGRGEAG